MLWIHVLKNICYTTTFMKQLTQPTRQGRRKHCGWSGFWLGHEMCISHFISYSGVPKSQNLYLSHGEPGKPEIFSGPDPFLASAGPARSLTPPRHLHSRCRVTSFHRLTVASCASILFFIFLLRSIPLIIIHNILLQRLQTHNHGINGNVLARISSLSVHSLYHLCYMWCVSRICARLEIIHHVHKATS